MARKIDYDLVFASSSDHSKDAEDVTRDLKDRDKIGWVSKKKPTYPQIVIFQLVNPANITRIQINSHDTFVPKKIEFFVASASPNDKDPNPRRLEYEPIGSTEFLETSGTVEEYKERRSVFVDCHGQFVKFKIHQSHKNPTQNAKNQVGLRTLAFLGYEEEGAAPTAVEETEEYLRPDESDYESEDEKKYKRKKKKSSKSHCCDCGGEKEKKSKKPKAGKQETRRNGKCPGNPLEQIRSVVRALEQKKQEAVDLGNLFTADNITVAIRELHKTVDKIEELEERRRDALDRDDERGVESQERRARRNLDLGLIDIGIDDFLSRSELARLGVAIGVNDDMCYSKADQGECGNPNHKYI